MQGTSNVHNDGAKKAIKQQETSLGYTCASLHATKAAPAAAATVAC
jgi:hypothetical protein